MDKQTTPTEITPQIIEFCKTIDATQTPVYVDFIDAPGMIKGDCFCNVPRHIKHNGGRVQYGWTIWEEPNALIEAEFHAVWVNDDGKMFDVTPKLAGEKRTVFLPDSQRVYKNIPVNNVRLILSKVPSEIASYKLNEELCNLRIKYNVDGKQSDIPSWELQRLEPLFKEAFGHKPPANPLRRKIGKDDACPCGSGKKYRHCHMGNPLSLF